MKFSRWLAQSDVAVEYYDCISVGAVRPTFLLDMTQKYLMVIL